MSWPLVRFDSLYAENSRNGLYKPKRFHGAGAKIVNMGELFAHRFIGPQEMSRLRIDQSEEERFALEDGDLLFARRSLIESGAGRCVLVEGLDETTVFESSLIRVRLADGVVPRFYFYYFASPQGRARIEAIITGAAQKGIRGTELAKIEVHRPPVAIQRRIADVLSAYDALIENNGRRIALLEESARLLHREWFVRMRYPGHEREHLNGAMPPGWKRKPLGELATFTMGQSPPSKFYNTEGKGLPFHQGVADFGERYVTHRVYCTERTRLARPGDILFSVRAPVGRINITNDEIVIGRGLAAIRSREGNQSFLFYQLRSHFHREDMLGGGAIFASVGKKQLLAEEMVTPLRALRNEFERHSQPIDHAIARLTHQNTRLAEARDALLPRLMNGSLVA